MPSRSEIYQKIAPFERVNSFKGYLSFVIDVAIYAIGLAGVLFMDNIAGKILGCVLMASGLVNLGSLSHEAAHKCVVKSRFGNQLISLVSFTVILFNYRLWVHDHHVLHHGRTNVKHHNFLSPLTLEEYRSLGPFRQALYRSYHTKSGLGILLYYMIERWPSVHFYPGSWLPKRLHASAWKYTALEAAYAIGLATLLITVASSRGESAVLAVVLGLVIPCLSWFMVFSMTAFLQHTNPRLRWHGEHEKTPSMAELTAVHVRVPSFINHMTHYVLEHQVHHVSAKIPHYYLKQAQAALAEISQPPMIVMPFTFANMSDVLKRCRLYDYKEHVWLDFDGNVTGIPDETVAQRKALESALNEPSKGIFFPDQKQEHEHKLEGVQ